MIHIGIDVETVNHKRAICEFAAGGEACGIATFDTNDRHSWTISESQSATTASHG